MPNSAGTRFGVLLTFHTEPANQATHLEALRAFNDVVDPKVRRVALIDTLQDEKFEAIRVAEALGKDLYGVRLDTPSSRRGDFYQIISEVRWELDIRGFGHVKQRHLTAAKADESALIEQFRAGAPPLLKAAE